VVSIETIVLQVPWQWYSNWKRIFAYILESNKECKQRKACLDFFVLVFDRKHVLFAFKTLQILILFSTHAFFQYKIFAISLSFDQIRESYICVPYFSNKERWEEGCCERKCGSRRWCDKQRQWLLFLIFNNLIRRVTRTFYLLENSYFNVEKGPLLCKMLKRACALVKRWTDQQD